MQVGTAAVRITKLYQDENHRLSCNPRVEMLSSHCKRQRRETRNRWQPAAKYAI
jgi:hypothetical protein